MIILSSGAAWAAPIYSLEQIDSRPHRSDCYTQGFFLHGGRLYESCGLYGQSSLASQPFIGESASQLVNLTAIFFAEGAAEADGEIYLLTWREGSGFVFDPETLEKKRHFSYQGEGWGLAYDGQKLWRSDGSANLYAHRPGDFSPLGETVTVLDGGREVSHLNELEWDPVTGLLLANIYGRDMVAAIDLNQGRVAFWLDARALRGDAEKDGLRPDAPSGDVVLNGLALGEGGLWLTGKFWPKIYQVAWPPAALKP